MIDFPQFMGDLNGLLEAWAQEARSGARLLNGSSRSSSKQSLVARARAELEAVVNLLYAVFVREALEPEAIGLSMDEYDLLRCQVGSWLSATSAEIVTSEMVENVCDDLRDAQAAAIACAVDGRLHRLVQASNRHMLYDIWLKRPPFTRHR